MFVEILNSRILLYNHAHGSDWRTRRTLPHKFENYFQSVSHTTVVEGSLYVRVSCEHLMGLGNLLAKTLQLACNESDGPVDEYTIAHLEHILIRTISNMEHVPFVISSRKKARSTGFMVPREVSHL